ncbi:hypothetical protein Tco_0078745 [Tanacetum coccineum]
MVDTHIKEQVKKQVPEQVRDQVPVYVAEGLILERQKTKEEMERMIAKAILQEQRIYKLKFPPNSKSYDNRIHSQVDLQYEVYMSGQIFMSPSSKHRTTSVPKQQYQLYLSMKDNPQLQTRHSYMVGTPDEKTFEYKAYVSGESSSGQVNGEERGPSTSGNQEKVDDYDFWTDSYASDDDEIPMKQVSQDIMEEVSLTIDEAKLKKMADEMLRQRCTSGDEHQYHIDLWEKIVARRANECIVLITKPDYKNLNKNDIEDMYLLIMNGKVPDYAEIGLLWSLSVFIRSSVIWEKVHDFQLGIESYQQKVNLTAPTISFPGVENTKCSPSSMSPVLEGLMSYNNDVKYGYIQRDLTNEEVEYLKLFKEEIEAYQLSIHGPFGSCSCIAPLFSPLLLLLLPTSILGQKYIEIRRSQFFVRRNPCHALPETRDKQSVGFVSKKGSGSQLDTAYLRVGYGVLGRISSE